MVVVILIGTAIGVMSLLLAGIADRCNGIGISIGIGGILVVAALLLLLFVGTERRKMPHLATDKTGELLPLDLLRLVSLFTLVRTVCKTVPGLLATMAEQHPWRIIAGSKWIGR